MYGDGTEARLTPDGKPLPAITPLNEGFFASARRAVFTIQTCRDCGDRHVPESPVCPRCLGGNQEWRAASGTGSLESWVEFHRAYWDGFKPDLPYLVGLARLEEGPLFVAPLHLGDGTPTRGALVRVRFHPATEAIHLPRFELA